MKGQHGQLQSAGLAIARMEPLKTDVPNCDEGLVEKEAGKAAVIGEVQKVLPTISGTHTNCTLISTLAETVLLSCLSFS